MKFKEFLLQDFFTALKKFKAFFMAGGPGSGKTFIASNTFTGTGLKFVNSDSAFERGLKQAGLSDKMPDQEKYFRDIIRGGAKRLTNKRLEFLFLVE